MKSFVLAALFLASSSLYAGGSFNVNAEFMPVKSQIPELWASLSLAFDIAKSGGANMVGNNVNERLGHSRIGPYCLPAKPKGNAGPYTLSICFNTEIQWLGGNGQPVELPEAFSYSEKFVSVEITPWSSKYP